MRILYLDCFAGISGDMFLGALLDLGVSLDELTETLRGLYLEGFLLTTARTVKNGIAATKATVHIDWETGFRDHRHLPDILNIIAGASLSPKVKATSSEVFRALASAEAKVHGIPPENVHFHEVGALDAIIDIVGTVAALELLGVDRIICSPLPLGSGFVECAHGTLPLPAPATLELLKGIPTSLCKIAGETVTPTGAALVKTLSAYFGPIPSILVEGVGYGAGDADRTVPNLVRAILGTTAENCDAFIEEEITVVEANIDDMNPEFFDHIFSLLFSAGVLDVFVTPVLMKKGRPAQVLSCLVSEACLPAVLSTIFNESTALGVRTHSSHRYKLAREIKTVTTSYGQVNVKLGLNPSTGQVLNIAPEWEDCRALAANHKVPVKIVYDLAKAEYYKKLQSK